MGRFKKNHIFIFASTALLILSFQNCSKIQMSTVDQSATQNGFSADPGDLTQPSNPKDPLIDPLVSQPDPEPFVSDPMDPGLKGGHFDLDTSHEVYAFDQGTTDHHEHEYDDKYGVNSVDFYNLLQKDFTKITDRVAAGQEFIVIVANADLSPGAVLEFNGEAKPVVAYQQRVDNFIKGDSLALATYTLETLKSFKLKFATNNLGDGILVPTETKCVRQNNASARGEYRNGALTIQILEKSSAQIDGQLRVAKPNGGLLWEATVFWHRDSTCQ
jgi:hypothetical protein